MHLITCRHEGRERVGVLHDRNVVLLPPDGWPASMLDLIAAGPAWLSTACAPSCRGWPHRLNLCPA